ncbi:MAG: M28 family peptidase [Candidatus Thermoplasmatota archaeon]
MKHIQKTQITSSIIVFCFFVSVLPAVSSSFIGAPQSPGVSQDSTHLSTDLYNPKVAAALSQITEGRLREILTVLVGFSPRFTGTYGCEQAANYIYDFFQSNHLQTRYHNWSSWGNEYHRRFFSSRNIEATIPGTDKKNTVLLFSAHYDGVKSAPAANDDGSGTAAVLLSAAVLNQFSFNHTLKFVAFSGEEIGLLGSHAYAKESYENHENILLNINADMIGHAETSEGGSRMGISSSEDLAWLFDIADSLCSIYDIDLTISRGSINRDGRGWSDYFSFIEYGYEAFACWGGEHDPNMHTSKDDLNNVNFSYLVKTTRLITALLGTLADYEDFYPQVTIASPRIGKLYIEGREKRSIGDLKTIVLNDIWIWADVRYASVPILRAEFYLDDRLMYTDTQVPFSWQFNKFSVGTHRVTILVYDELGRKSSEYRDIRFINLLLKK